MATIQVKINGVDKSSLVDWASLSISQVLTSQPDSATFLIKNVPSKTYRPALNDTVQIYNNTTLIFAGVVLSTKETVQGLLKFFEVSCKDYTELLDGALCVAAYSNQTVSYIINDLLTNFAPAGVTMTHVDGTAVVNAATFNYISISQALAQLAGALPGYDWYIDYNKDIHFFQATGYPAPFSLNDSADVPGTAGNFNYSSLEFDADISQIKNQVVVRGGTITQNPITNNQVSDGVQLIYYVGYNLNSNSFTATGTAASTIHVTGLSINTASLQVGMTVIGANIPSGATVASIVSSNAFDLSIASTGTVGTLTFNAFVARHAYAGAPTTFLTLTIGQDGVDNPASFDCLYNPNLGLLRFPTAWASGDIIQTTGTPSYPLLTILTDPFSLATYGQKEFLIYDKNMVDKQQSIIRAQAELAKNKDPIYTGTFVTYKDGLTVGQNLNINLTSRSLSGTFKIQQIDITLRTPSQSTSDLAYKVQFCSTLDIGLIEILNRLLISDVAGQLTVGANEVPDRVYGINDTITVGEAVASSISHNPQSETMTVSESFTAQTLGYAVIFVAGPFTPSGTSRIFVCDGSRLG